MSLKERFEFLQGKKDEDVDNKKSKKKKYKLTKEQLDFLDELVDMSIDYVYLIEMNEYQIYFRIWVFVSSSNIIYASGRMQSRVKDCR